MIVKVILAIDIDGWQPDEIDDISGMTNAATRERVITIMIRKISTKAAIAAIMRSFLA